MASVNDIPPQARGTVQIGGTDYHYMRSAKTNQLYLVRGPDRRDWSQIDAGAVSYADMAVAEHNAAGESFTGHDGPRIAAACPLCAEGGVAGKDEIATLKALATQRDQNGQFNRAALNAQARLAELGHAPDQAPADLLVMPPLTPERQAEVDAANAARQAQADQQAAQAMADQQAKARMQAELEQTMANALAAGLDITRRDGEDTQTFQARLRQATEARHAQTTQQQPATAQAQATQGITGAADPKDNAGIPPTDPDVIAGADPAVLATAIVNVDGGVAEPLTEDRELGPFHNPANDTFTSEILPPGMGRDPWTREQVRITRNTGADAEAPYGRKRDGTPRRASGKHKAQP
jgi:hypothetical protein